MEAETIKALKLFAERNYVGAELHVGSVSNLCAALDIQRHAPANANIATFYGLPVVEREYIPANRAALIDKSGKVIRIFDF